MSQLTKIDALLKERGMFTHLESGKLYTTNAAITPIAKGLKVTGLLASGAVSYFTKESAVDDAVNVIASNAEWRGHLK